MRNTWKSLVRRAASNPVADGLASRLVRLMLWLNPEISSRVSASGWGRTGGAVLPLAVDTNVEKLLGAIPSETSLRERRFLYRFFGTIWGGKNDVIEIGPFLGGTSRAIALGMCDNPRISENAKLRTFDRFYGYYDLPSLIELLDPLVKAGILDPSDLQSLGDNADFLRIFERIHADNEYYQRIVPSNMMVPDRPEDLEDRDDYLRIPEETLVSAVFVDGCKSWYGTKYFMQEAGRVAESGAYFLFQDYGWYTCFWIPAFLELLRDCFQLVGYVDTTYAFTLVKPLSSEAIEMRYPDSPSELGEDGLIEIFDRLVDDAASRNDYAAVVRHTLQKAGALAYVGNKAQAIKIIKGLKRDPWAFGDRTVIAAAAESPTYSPDGRIFLK